MCFLICSMIELKIIVLRQIQEVWRGTQGHTKLQEQLIQIYLRRELITAVMILLLLVSLPSQVLALWHKPAVFLLMWAHVALLFSFFVFLSVNEKVIQTSYPSSYFEKQNQTKQNMLHDVSHPICQFIFWCWLVRMEYSTDRILPFKINSDISSTS